MIVSRGLGKGAAGAIVAAGLGVSLLLAVLPPTYFPSTPVSGASAGPDYGKLLLERIPQTLTLSPLVAEGLLKAVEARGAGKAALYSLEGAAELRAFKPSGAAKANLVIVNSATELGGYLAEGHHDVSDEAIASMILALLDLA